MSKETKDKPVWKEDNKRFVCFLDIMGFKDMVYNENHLVVKNKLIALSQIRQQIIDVTTDLNNGVEKYPQYENCEIKPIAFSDSIVFFTNEDKPNDFLLLSYAVKSIVSRSIKLGIPIKGAISHGLLTANFEKSVFFCKPLINAYLLQEEIQYYGVVLDNHAEAFLNANKEAISTSSLYFSIKTPLKKGVITHTNLSLLNNSLKGSDLNNLYNTVCGSTRIYVDNTISVFNTITDLKIKLDTVATK